VHALYVRQKKMNESATTVLWLTSLILPALIFYAGGIARSIYATSIRALLAIGCGWIFMVAYAQAAQFLSQKPINGAALAFASVFGWVLPTAVVGCCLFIRWIIVRRYQHKIAEQGGGGNSAALRASP
jgi:hypothetical protein